MSQAVNFGVSVPPSAAPADLVALAVAAEEAGWDGFFLWDHIYIEDGLPLHDPWVLLGAMAAATLRVRLGAMVTPVARRRPWKLAKEILTVDHLSGGRVVVGVGLGAPEAEFAAFGEPAGARERGDLLDEALVVLDGLLRGDQVAHDGERLSVHARLAPGPVQSPRPPIWAAATWSPTGPHRRPLERGARYDGVFGLGVANEGGLSLEQIAEVRRRLGPGKDIMVPLEAPLTPAQYAEAGATWLVSGPEKASDPVDRLDEVRAQISAGPPEGPRDGPRGGSASATRRP